MTSRKAPVLEWETDVHLVTHPLMLANVAKMFVITAAVTVRPVDPVCPP